MPDLKNTLHGVDLQYLRHIAEKWGLALDAPDARRGAASLEEQITDPDLVGEMIEALSEEAQEGLSWLLEQEGRAGWDAFTRRFGEVREMGSGKRERERPDLDPVSAAEVLWYRAFISRGFFDSETGPKEFVFIPDDLKRVIGKHIHPSKPTDSADLSIMLARKATPEERETIHSAGLDGVDHTCTLLAGLRASVDPDPHLPGVLSHELAFYSQIFQGVGLVDDRGQPVPDQIRAFFELTRAETLLHMWQGWLSNPEHDDLALTPGLQPEGTWDSQPRKVRAAILEIISQLPQGTWMSISSFVARIRQHHPDFLRSAGEFDSWYIKDERTGDYLRGFNHWEDVEGAYLRYLLTGPLHWLGAVDLGRPGDSSGQAWTAFLVTAQGTTLFRDEVPDHDFSEDQNLKIRSKGLIRVPRRVPRRVRYQIARFCEWKPLKQEAYTFTLTTDSLQRAKGQGLAVSHLLTLLEHYSEAVPPNIVQALQRWEQEGVQAAMKSETILRVRSPSLLQALQDSRARRFLGEKLGTTAVVIQEGSEEKIADVLVEMGFFADYAIHIKDKEQNQVSESGDESAH